MPAPDFEKLMEHASASDREELQLVCDGKSAAMLAYKSKPGKETKADYDAARDLYQETLDRLTRDYFPEDVPAPEGERFKNRVQALNWLQGQGYKVSQGKFYGDCKAGFPAIHKDGTISRFQVLQYGQQLDIEKKGGKLADEQKADEADIRKRIAEAEMAERKNEREKRQLDADWLHRPEAVLQVAALMGKIRASLRRRFYTGYPEVIRKCNGDQSRGNEVYEYMDNLALQALNEVAGNGRVEGILVKKESDAHSAA